MFKISAIIPTHNRATLLIRAINSILAQTYPVHEIVVVDDGSTDSTKDELCRFVNSLHSSVAIRYIYQEQQGVAAARNAGIAQTSSEWIAFLDSDDVWLPEKLEWQVKALQQYEKISEACITDAKYANNPLLVDSSFTAAGHNFASAIGLIPEYARRITSHKFHGGYLQALLIRRELIESLGGFHAAFPVNEDTDFFFQLAQHTSVCYVNLPLAEIDRTPDRIVGLNELRKKENYRLEMAQLMYEKWLREYQGVDPEIRKGIRRRLHDIHIGWASVHLVEGDVRKALRSVSQALNYSTSLKGGLKWVLIKFAPGSMRSELVRRRARPAPPLL